MFEHTSYTKQDDDEIIGVLYGHFSPFTGPTGHGRLLTALQNIGATRFIVAMPDVGDKLDADRNLFTTLQRKEIIEDVLKEMNLDGQVLLIKTGRGVQSIFWYIARTIAKSFGPKTRPVFCFGLDREADFAQYLTPFGTTDNDLYEYVCVQDRGTTETSGTKVRELLKTNNIIDLKRLTGYSDDLIDKLCTWTQKNLNILSRQSKQVDAMSGKHHLKHMYADNSASRLNQSEFKHFIEYVKKSGGFISNENFNITEKVDGSSSFVGFDDYGFYFAKFGVSNKMRRVSDVGEKYQAFFTILRDSGLVQILEDWKTTEGVDDLKVQLENVIPGTSKSETGVQTVLVNYDSSLIGKGLVLTIQVIADGVESSNSKEIMRDVQACLSKTGLTCTSAVTMNIESIDISEEIEVFQELQSEKPSMLKAIYTELQQTIQNKILENITHGTFGPEFEGIVFSTKDNSLIFKVTSNQFKELMKMHNNKKAKKRVVESNRKRRLQEGGNLITNGKNGEQQATKLLTREMGPELFEEFKDIFKDFLLEFEKAFEAETGMCFWRDKSLIDHGEIFSGSTRTLFTKDWETYSSFKPKVGDMDVQIPDWVNKDGIFHKFLIDHQGESFGAFELYGSKEKDTNNQGHSLITMLDEKFWPYGGQYIQIDWEYTAWDDNDRPNDWVNIAHYSSWEDIENNIKGAFVKILIRATIDTISERPDLLEPSIRWTSAKTGKPVKNPNWDKENKPKSMARMKKFSVDGGLQNLINVNVDGSYSKPEIKNRIRSFSSKDVFETIFGREPVDAEMKNLLSYIRYCKMINRELPEDVLSDRLFKRFIKYLWADYAQALSRDIEEDTGWKEAAVEKYFELIPCSDTPENWSRAETNKNHFVEIHGDGATLIESSKNKKKKLKESVEGDLLKVYSSSKDTDLFKYYIGDKLKLGMGGGSAYGLATYAILEEPWSDTAKATVGYSDKQRSNLYGDNCFEFSISTDKVFFFNWEDFEQTRLCKDLGATPEDFIELQCEYFQLPEQVKKSLTSLEKREFSSNYAQTFFKLMSRYYYQDARGGLRTPCAGFVYTGHNDGHTFVGWNSKALTPERFTSDFGQTWITCDKTTPEYKAFLNNNSRNYSKNDDVVSKRIFDGNKTPEKNECNESRKQRNVLNLIECFRLCFSISAFSFGTNS